MTEKPITPNLKRPLEDVENGKYGDQSDDDSEIIHDRDQRGGHVDADQDKSHDQDVNYIVEAESNYSLFTNPPDLANIRHQLFAVDHEIELSDKDFEEYFPFVDNVWRKNRSGETVHDAQGTTETFSCRLKPSGSQSKASTPRPPVEGKQQRRKRKREERTCDMAIKVTYIEGPIKKVKITKAVSPDITHSHDLDYMDMSKRNSAIMDVARREAHRAFLPGSIWWKMQEEPDKIEEAGGKFMKISDVRNVQYPWRQQNANVTLKAHAGYSQQRSGPRPRPATGSAPGTPRNGHARPAMQAEAYTSPAPLPPPAPPRAQQAAIPQNLPADTLNYPENAKAFLRSYLPYVPKIASQQRPHVTLTWATSLDSRIALQPGVQTAISGPETKAMTHFLRSQHDAILIGVKTAVSDDPGLNCRLLGAGGFGGQKGAMQPRPIIIDPRARLRISPEMAMLRRAAEGKALGPWIVVGPGIKLPSNAVATLKQHGGEFLQINEIHPEFGLDWVNLFSILHREGIKSIMIEGGGKVLSELLKPTYTHCIDSIVITIAPTFFGRNGVEVSPETTYEGQQPIQTRLTDITWQPMGTSDMVLCAKMDKSRPVPPSQPYQQPQQHIQPQPPAPPPRLPGIQEFSRMSGPSPTHPVPPPPQQHHPQGPPHQYPSQAQQPPQTNGSSKSSASETQTKFRHYNQGAPPRRG